MADWIRLNSRKTIDEFMESFGGFHDACLREVSIATETYVGQSGAMSCPAHLDTSVLMWFQSQGAKHRAVEIHCEGVSFLQLSATPAGCDSILSAGVLSNEGATCRLGLSFVGGPLVGAPNSFVEIAPNDPHSAPDIVIEAASMSWRPLAGAEGPTLRYRQS
jgi:hypothetical protein